MLKIEHLVKSYGNERKAVDDLSFDVYPGEIFGFIGHNGAGKTTTLRSVAGIMQFNSGSITVDGHAIDGDPVAAKKVMAFLPDNPDLYEFMKGIDYLNFIADMYEIGRGDREARIKRFADAFSLTKNLGNPIGSYSHGMKQKLALISAFIRDPKLLILDEPFVGLDPSAAFTMKGFLRDLCVRGGAVLFSTHVLEVAEKLCNRIAIIKDGRLVVCGPMNEVIGNSDLESVFLDLEQRKGDSNV